MTTTSSIQPTTAWWRPQASPRRTSGAIAQWTPGAITQTPGSIEQTTSVAAALVRKDSSPSTASVVAFRALVTFTVILLLSPQTWFPALGPFRIAFVAAILAIGAHLLDRMVHGRSDAAFNPEIGIALLLVGWAVMTLPVSYWIGGSVEVLTSTYLKAVAFFWLVGTLATSARRLRAIAWTLVCCAVPLAIVGIRNYLAGDVLTTGVPGLTRIYGYMGGSGLAANPNDLALMLNLIIPIAAAMMIATRRIVLRAFAAAVMLLSIGGVIVTFSRAGFLTLSATGIMLLAVLIRRHSAGAASFLVVVALVAPLFVPDSYFKRLSTITDIQADETGSAQGRWRDVVMASDIVLRNPIVGAGIGNDMLALNTYRGKATYRSVHNAYLQYAVDLGLPGMLLFAWLHITCFRNARRVERRSKLDDTLRPLGPLAAGIQVSLVTFFVAAMFHPIAYQFYFFTIAGLAVALHNTARSMPAVDAPRPAPGRRAAVAVAS